MRIPHRPSRDEAVELCLAALATGTAYGFSPNHDPDVMACASCFAQNPSGELSMWRDWGLIEAHFSRWRAGDPWSCEFFMVQAHRMAKPPKWKALRRELERAGHEVVDDDFRTDFQENFRVVAANTGAVVADRRAMKISIPAAPFPHRPTSMSGAGDPPLREVARAGPGDWPAWLDRLNPATGDWAWLLGHLHALHRDEPDRRPAWTEFGLWLFDQARERAVWPAEEWAWHWSRFVLERPGAVPAGVVARECLPLLPMAPAELAELPADWRAVTPDQVRRARVTAALLRCAVEDVPPPRPVPAVAELLTLADRVGGVPGWRVRA